MRQTLALIPVLLALVAGPAFAHARLIRTAPRVGSTVRETPSELKLLFSEAIDPANSTVRLSGARGAVPAGPLTLDPADRRVVHLPIPRALSAGVYRVNWRVTSVDSHRTEGDFRFRVAP